MVGFITVKPPFGSIKGLCFFFGLHLSCTFNKTVNKVFSEFHRNWNKKFEDKIILGHGRIPFKIKRVLKGSPII
jgi:hypothetical protein